MQLCGRVEAFPLEEEYKKPTGITPQDISQLREWLRTQPHLPTDHITDLDLILIYHSCERSTEVSKQLLDLHYTLKTVLTRFFKDRTVDKDVEAALRYILFMPLPTRTRDGHAVLYTHFLERDPRKLPINDVLKAMLMVTDLWQHSEGTWPGFVIILNLEGMSIGHLARLDLVHLQKFIYYLEECLLMKLRGVHILNAPISWDKLLNIVKPFAKRSLHDIMTYPPGSKDIDKVIPVDALPKEAGGSFKSVEECRDLDLILTYHSCERSTEVSKQLLDLHYTLKTIFTRFFKDRTVDKNVEAALNSMLLLPLPTRTRDGYAVLYTHFLERDPVKFFLNDILRAIIMVVELWQYSEGTWPGFVMMCNTEGILVSLSHLTRFELASLQQFIYFLQEALLVKLKGFHILNTPPFWDKLLGVCKPFAKKSPLEMIVTHTPGLPNLDKVIPIDALPKEAGGSYKSVEECREDVISWMKANQQYFAAENKKRVDEALRPGAPKTISDIFGSVEGTFKQLEID